MQMFRTPKLPLVWVLGRAVMRAFVLLLTAFFVASCASSSSDISATYVSPLQYQHLTCQQIAGEADRVSRRASEVAGVQEASEPTMLGQRQPQS
jgi:hypothetical protein